MFFKEIWHKTSWYDFGQYFNVDKTGDVKGSLIGTPQMVFYMTKFGFLKRAVVL